MWKLRLKTLSYPFFFLLVTFRKGKIIPSFTRWNRKFPHGNIFITNQEDVWLHRLSDLFQELPLRKRLDILRYTSYEYFSGRIDRVKNYQKYGVIIPGIIMISITTECNLHCKGCFAQKYGNGRSIPLRVIDKAIKEMIGLGVRTFVISGGDPFLYPHLFDLIENNRKATFVIISNGTLIDQDIVKRIRKCRNIFPVLSLEGKRNTTDSRRGKG